MDPIRLRNGSNAPPYCLSMPPSTTASCKTSSRRYIASYITAPTTLGHALRIGTSIASSCWSVSSTDWLAPPPQFLKERKGNKKMATGRVQHPKLAFVFWHPSKSGRYIAESRDVNLKPAEFETHMPPSSLFIPSFPTTRRSTASHYSRPNWFPPHVCSALALRTPYRCHNYCKPNYAYFKN